MKHRLFYIMFFFASFLLHGQNTNSKSKDSSKCECGENAGKNIETTIITFKMSQPVKSSVANSNSKNIPRLVVPVESPLSFQLIEVNPFKYRYLLNYRLVDQYESKIYNPMDSLKKKSYSDYERGNKERDDSDSINKYTDQIKTIQEKQEVTGEEINDLKINIISYKESLVSHEVINWDNYRKKVKEFQNSFEELLSEFLKNKSEYEDIITHFEAKESIEANLSSKLERIQKYIIASDSISKGINKSKDFEIQLDSPPKLYLINANIQEKIEIIREILSELMNAKSFYATLPIDLNGENIDYVEFVVQRFEIGSSTLLDTYKPKVWLRGGLKFDVSAGIFLTTLKNREYTLLDDPLSTTGNRIIQEKNLGNFDYGIGSMLNMSLRGGSWIRPGVSLGLIFSDNQSFQGLAGVNLILGKSVRWVFHYGLSMGTIKKLSSGYNVNESRIYNFSSSESIPIDEKFEFGQFFGFTYNFKILEPKGKLVNQN